MASVFIAQKIWASQDATIRQQEEQAVTERRVLLRVQRKHTSSSRSQIGALIYPLQCSNLEDRVRELIQVFSLKYDESMICERCPDCNTCDWIRYSKEDMVGIVPVKVLDRQTNFRACSGCLKIFWEGLISEQARSRFAEYFDGTFTFEIDNNEAAILHPPEPQPSKLSA
eukprot:Gregarina_sp_Poly_1__1746@NODE_1450_length_4124_cov_47_742913_g962_i0_p5_GENE_NODE_1450_length_4124_cov_47_742913_g962_i0NODE_1450_length_4124_cov_47_742913_g962_i0_p5_ORF_typecomplete_len170_score28_43Mut7C/PF01927_16/8_2e19_NODE_1450_length_4124_cov_47_742913_g962_i014912000